MAMAEQPYEKTHILFLFHICWFLLACLPFLLLPSRFPSAHCSTRAAQVGNAKNWHCAWAGQPRVLLTPSIG